VRTSRITNSAVLQYEVQILLPLITYSSPSRRARVRSATRSEPASGSEKPWHHRTSPREIRGRCSAFCWSDPYFMIAGPIQLTFMYWGPRGSPIAHISSPMME